MRCRTGSLTMTLLWIACAARADLVVTIGDLNLQPGQTALVGVTIISNTPNTGDVLQTFGFDFRITPGVNSLTNQPVATRLEFVPNMDESYLATNANYVFSGDSSAVVSNSGFGSVGDVGEPRVKYVGGDATNSGNNVTLLPSDQKLLAQLQVTADPLLGPSPIAGDTFRISLDQTSGATGFWDATGTPVKYTVQSGDVNISAVPEPATIALMGVGGGLGVVGLLWCRSRKRPTADDKPEPLFDDAVTPMEAD